MSKKIKTSHLVRKLLTKKTHTHTHTHTHTYIYIYIYIYIYTYTHCNNNSNLQSNTPVHLLRLAPNFGPCLPHYHAIAFFPVVQQPLVGQGILITEASRPHSDKVAKQMLTGRAIAQEAKRQSLTAVCRQVSRRRQHLRVLWWTKWHGHYLICAVQFHPPGQPPTDALHTSIIRVVPRHSVSSRAYH
jgi:hypothetical protein